MEQIKKYLVRRTHLPNQAKFLTRFYNSSKAQERASGKLPQSAKNCLIVQNIPEMQELTYRIKISKFLAGFA